MKDRGILYGPRPLCFYLELCKRTVSIGVKSETSRSECRVETMMDTLELVRCKTPHPEYQGRRPTGNY